MRLDAKTVAALKLVGKTDAIFFDDDLPGFGFRLRLGAGGKLRRSWVAQYKRAGATRRLLLGAGEVLSAEQARQAAKKVLAKVALGEDPQADRIDRRGKDRLSLRSVVEEYLAAKQRLVRPRTLVEVRRYLTAHPYFGPLHGVAIDTVNRRDIATRLVAITREHGSVTAVRARTTLSAFFVWAMTMGIVEANPVIGTIKPQDNQTRDRVLSDNELRAVWLACGDDDFGRIVKLLILTGCRRSEIGDMTWAELDLERGLFTIPASRSKNGRTHTLPLTPTMVRIIKDVPRMAGRDQLFGQRSHGFTRWHKSKAELDARSGVQGWVTHDTRRTVATKLADMGTQPHIIECILGHQGGFRSGVASVYNKSPYTNEVRNTLLIWDDHVRTLVAGGERVVVPMSPHAAC
jgi:integrase